MGLFRGKSGVRMLLTRQGRNGMYHGEEPVEGEQQQRVDRGVGGDVGEVLHRLAPYAAEGPRGEDVVRSGEGYAEHDEEKVRHGQAARGESAG